MGSVAGVVGPVAALTVGGFGPVLVALGVLARPNRVRDYVGVVEDAADPVEPGAPPDARALAGESRKRS